MGHPGQSAQPDADAKRPIVVPVWAWWCGPCKKELPHIAEFAAGTTDYTVVGLQADPNAAAGISLLNDKGVDLPSLIDKDGSLQKTTGMPGLVPLVAVFDPAGEFIGYTATAIGSPADIEAAVNKVLESP
nr:TlpA disulfide reductase family protein [Corynebacterium mendelii]